MNGRMVKQLRNELFVSLKYDPKVDGAKKDYVRDKDFKKIFRAKKKNYMLHKQPWSNPVVENSEN